MNNHYPFVNSPLPYPYDAMEPYIDALTMELHHNRHLQTYVDNLNKLLKDYPAYHRLSLEELLLYVKSLPENIQTGIQNNAGGVYNHILYFSCLKNPSADILPGPLEQLIPKYFQDFEGFRAAFTKAALSVFGSGYAWLAADAFGHLHIMTTSNQDTPFSQNLFPLLNLDVWEHAYYLKHYNDRAAYIGDWFHLANWEQAAENYRRLFP
ncbi:superoxide dismutase [Ruminococcus sp. 5_1_39BFAA]|uniref:superoxide dismutase n=1 Tax=Ruminococcus sp. 5_1_39BFAA TaxID=457412 RepID=UPI00356584AA